MILGISSFYHDSAAVLVDDQGNIIAAAQEERFTRTRHTAAFPREAIRWCLEYAERELKDIEHIVFYENPTLKFQRIAETFLSLATSHPDTFLDVMPTWVHKKVFQTTDVADELLKIDAQTDVDSRLYCVPHHASHAASAYYPSPWNHALVVTVDGVGEYATTSVSVGHENKLKPLREIRYPNSLGLLYSAFTYFCGFKVNSGEYKLMGLAPYGTPKYAKTIKDNILLLHTDGSYSVNPEYFDAFVADKMVTSKLNKLLDGPPLPTGNKTTQREADIAASVQVVLEDAILNLVSSQLCDTGMDRVCLAGGVALNCVANARLTRDLPIKGLWIQPAAGDAGGALGAALFLLYETLQRPRVRQSNNDSMSGALLGPSYSDARIKKDLGNLGAVYRQMNEKTLPRECARLLAEGRILAWFQGRMEYGPRALGSRSILADPRSPTIQKDLNLKIKKRESFRPFAPAILKEEVSNWFDLAGSSHYMLLTAPILPKHRRKIPAITTDRNFLVTSDHSTIPAVTHVDFSARVQTVDKEINPVFHELLTQFNKTTGCPILLNTSFNVRGEPIVCTPRDAFRCFMNTEIDYLAIGNFLLKRTEQDPLVELQCTQTFEMD